MTDDDALAAACHAAARRHPFEDLDPVVYVVTTLGPTDQPAALLVDAPRGRNVGRGRHPLGDVDDHDDLFAGLAPSWLPRAIAEAIADDYRRAKEAERRWHRMADARILFGDDVDGGMVDDVVTYRVVRK